MVYDYIEETFSSTQGKQFVKVCPMVCTRSYYENAWTLNNQDTNNMGGTLGDNYKVYQNQVYQKAYINNPGLHPVHLTAYKIVAKTNYTLAPDTINDNFVYSGDNGNEGSVRAHLSVCWTDQSSGTDPISDLGHKVFHHKFLKNYKILQKKAMVLGPGANYTLNIKDTRDRVISYSEHVAPNSNTDLREGHDIFKGRTQFWVFVLRGVVAAPSDSNISSAVSVMPATVNCIFRNQFHFSFSSPHNEYSELRGNNLTAAGDLNNPADCEMKVEDPN